MNKIALGTVQFGIDYGVNSTAGQVHPSEVAEILTYARSQNIVLIDTASAYGNSEQVLGDTGVQNFNIVTKTRHFEQSIIDDKAANLLVSDFNQSLQSLKQSSIYGILVHNADDLLKPGADKIVKQLQSLKEQGVISKVGVSVYTGDQLQSVMNNIDIDLVQLPFNILDRRLIDNGMLRKLTAQGIEVHARSIFLQGLLLMNKNSRPDYFSRWNELWKFWHEWLVDNKITALEATIRYVISITEISKILVGVDSKVQLQEIIQATSGIIPTIPEELLIDDTDLLNPVNWRLDV
jgi:aryl-alcohol dehydrogenase-like predicted oxidoreductase